MATLDVPVLVVGGGGCGLTASIFLSDHGVDHLLVERHAGTSTLPKAHYLNQRTMEIFRQHHVADSIYAVGAPLDHFGKVSWVTSLGTEPGTLYGRTLAEMDAFGGGSLTSIYLRDSPSIPSNYPLIRLEPLLRRHAEERAPGRILFNHELIGWTEDKHGVTAQIVDASSAERHTVRAQYVIAADGGKSVGARLGVTMEGPVDLMEMVTTHFSADLSPWWDDQCLMTWIIDPAGGNSYGTGALVQLGPTWGKHSEEWMLHFTFGPGNPGANDESAILPKMRELLKLPDFDPTMHKVSRWVLESVLADRYRVGRFFLAGDAVHRHPPATGIGLNTAIQDAHNLAWKLAAVVQGRADEELLNSYEAERRPVGRHNVDWAMFSALHHVVLDTAVGLPPGAPVAMRQAACEAYFADSPTGELRRRRAAEVAKGMRAEFQAHDLEIGFSYCSGAVVADGTPLPDRDPMGCEHQPTTRPGHRLPHAWINHAGQQLSTLDLTGSGQAFVLLTGTGGEAWGEAAEVTAKRLGVPLQVVQIGERSDFTDPTGAWTAVREIDDGGAVLVRPDNHVAFRSLGAATDPIDMLEAALVTVLGRGVVTTTSPSTTHIRGEQAIGALARDP